MLRFVTRTSAFVPSEGTLEHTDHLPFLVSAVRSESEYAGIAQSCAILQALDAYGNDGWAVLRECGLLEPGQVKRARMRCVYAPGQVAFFPTALLSAETVLPVDLPARMTPRELAHYNERVLTGLSNGRYAVSRHAREALGQGYSAQLRPEHGVGALSVMELALSNGSSVLGWGWVWHPCHD